MQSKTIQNWLENSPQWIFVTFSMMVAFSTYFCMYAFRKPFSAGTYTNFSFLGTEIDLKTAFVTSQIIGYALSKFLGIKYCSEITRKNRAVALISLILIAELALLLFAVVPNNLKVIAIFFNGLPLGMIWGLVVWYLEGRRTSELLLAGLSCSYIVSSGIVKDVGRGITQAIGQENEFWMPFLTGLIFLLPYLICVYLLNHIPDPNAKDILQRVKRQPMDGEKRWSFVFQFFLGISLIMIFYFFLTAYRDFRDNFGVEIYNRLGYADDKTIFSRTEIAVGLGVMPILGLLFLVRNNRWGLMGAFTIMIVGTTLLGVSTILFDFGIISGLMWMILNGFGLYLAYVPHGSVLFDRIIASTRIVGTSVFAIYVADALGYVGSISIMMTKDIIFGSETSRLDFFRMFSYAMAIGSAVLLIASAAYFWMQRPAPISEENPA